MQIPAFSSILRQQSIKKSEKRRMSQATDFKRFVHIPKHADDDNYILSESFCSSSDEVSSNEEGDAGKRPGEK